MATAQTSPNDLTRQQLDELDALLQRMLSLPMSPPETYSPPAVTPLPAPTPTPTPILSLAAFAPPLPQALPTPAPIAAPPITRYSEPAPAPAPVFAPPAPLFTPPAPVAEAPRPAPAPAVRKAPEPAPRPVPVPAPTPAAKREPAPAPKPVPAVPKPVPVASPITPAPAPSEWDSVPLLLAPLVLFNRLVNGTLGLFGLPGRVLRSGFVKTLFGLTGLGLLVYTGLKVAQLHGWVALPVELPWPR